MLPRWRPSYGVEAALKDAFLGYVGPFDVWFDDEGDGDHSLVVVGPSKTKIVEEGGHNFDTFRVFGDMLERDDQEDLHIGLDIMCLIYQLCVENNIVREDPNG